MAGPRDLNRTFSPRAICNEFLRRLPSSVVASVEKSLSESARLRRNFYRSIRFYYADKVIGIRTIRFENLYLYLRERVAFLLFYRAKLQYHGILFLKSFLDFELTIFLCTYTLPYFLPYRSLRKKIIRIRLVPHFLSSNFIPSVLKVLIYLMS